MEFGNKKQEIEIHTKVNRIESKQQKENDN